MDRRKRTRFALSAPVDAHVRVLQEVEIEAMAEGALTVISAGPGVRGEDTTLAINGPSGHVAILLVRTMESEPVMFDDRLAHRLLLQVIETSEGSEGR